MSKNKVEVEGSVGVDQNVEGRAELALLGEALNNVLPQVAVVPIV